VHTGTAHILASAGLHVGVILLCLLGLLKLAGTPRKAASAIGIAVLVLFMFAAGGRPAVVRACVVAIVWLGGKFFEREPDFLTSLGVAAGIILWMQPTALLEPGFQLSFATVGVLCAAMPVWKKIIERYTGITKLKGNKREIAVWIADLIGISLFAQLGSMPIIAATFNEVSICSVWANIFVVPLVFLIIPIGGAAAATAGPVSMILFRLAGLLVVGVERLVRFFSGVPLAYMAVMTPSPAVVFLYYAVLGVAIYWLDMWVSLVVAKPGEVRMGDSSSLNTGL
jgi:competence protein ComEC